MKRHKRRSKPTTKKLEEFLNHLAETGNVLASAELTNLNRRELYRLRTNDQEFAAAWDEALSQAADALEAEARRRALDGWDEPVFYQGVESGYVRKYSDTLLIFLLKGLRPDRFRDRVSTELSGPGGPRWRRRSTFTYRRTVGMRARVRRRERPGNPYEV